MKKKKTGTTTTKKSKVKKIKLSDLKKLKGGIYYGPWAGFVKPIAEQGPQGPMGPL